MTSVSTLRPELPPQSQRARDHAATMDRVYRYQRYIYDLTRKYYLFGRDRLIAELAALGEERVLEVGCGTGRNLVVAARRYPRARFFGIDISQQMLASAEASARRVGLGERISTQLGDATSFDSAAAFGGARFDRVFLSYSLSMVPEWERALAQSLAQTAPGGSLHLVDFGQMERWPAVLRAAMRWWLARFHVTPRATLIARAESLAKANGFCATTTRIAGGYAWHLVLRRPPELAVRAGPGIDREFDVPRSRTAES